MDLQLFLVHCLLAAQTFWSLIKQPFYPQPSDQPFEHFVQPFFRPLKPF
jgi:hypothetical protein